MVSRAKIAVILAAHGEAETTRFLENYRVSRHTLAHASRVMPIAKPLQRAIAVTSSLKKMLRARTDAHSSPQNRITRDQAAALQQHLNASCSPELFDCDVYAAFAASHPYVENIIEETRHCDGQVIVSMAPVDTSLSCGLLCSFLALSRQPEELAGIKVLSRFWDDERIYSIYLDHLFEKSSGRAAIKDEKRILLLLFHGTLVADAKGNAPQFHTGLDATRCFALRLQQLMQSDSRNPYGRIMTVYLNHNVGGEWTKPSFEDICTSLRNESDLSVDLFACGYFADGNETIHRAAELMTLSSVSDATSIPCLNSTLPFTDYLTSKVIDAARQIMSLR
jgi:ferrochelatase